MNRRATGRWTIHVQEATAPPRTRSVHLRALSAILGVLRQQLALRSGQRAPTYVAAPEGAWSGRQVAGEAVDVGGEDPETMAELGYSGYDEEE